MIKKIRGIIAGSKVAIETIFNEFCLDKVNKRMS